MAAELNEKQNNTEVGVKLLRSFEIQKVIKY